MPPLEAALWSLLGALSFQAFVLITQLNSYKVMRWPWAKGEVGPRLLSLASHLFIGFALGLVGNGEVTGKIGLFFLGVGGPLIIGTMVRYVREQRIAPGAEGMPGLGPSAEETAPEPPTEDEPGKEPPAEGEPR